MEELLLNFFVDCGLIILATLYEYVYYIVPSVYEIWEPI